MENLESSLQFIFIKRRHKSETFHVWVPIIIIIWHFPGYDILHRYSRFFLSKFELLIDMEYVYISKPAVNCDERFIFGT